MLIKPAIKLKNNKIFPPSTHIKIIIRSWITSNNTKQSTADFAPFQPFTMIIIVNFHAIVTFKSLKNSFRAIHIAAAINVAIELQKKMIIVRLIEKQWQISPLNRSCMRSWLCSRAGCDLMEVLPVSSSFPLLARQKLMVLELMSKPEWYLAMMQSKMRYSRRRMLWS